MVPNVELGMEVVDTITSKSGKVIGIANYLFGSAQALVAFRGCDENVAGTWVDTARLQEIGLTEDGGAE